MSPCCQQRQQLGERLVDDRGGHHQPDRPGRRELFDKVGQRCGPDGASLASRPRPADECRRPRTGVRPSFSRRTMLAPIRPKPSIPSCMTKKPPNCGPRASARKILPAAMPRMMTDCERIANPSPFSAGASSVRCRWRVSAGRGTESLFQKNAGKRMRAAESCRPRLRIAAAAGPFSGLGRPAGQNRFCSWVGPAPAVRCPRE